MFVFSQRSEKGFTVKGLGWGVLLSTHNWMGRSVELSLKLIHPCTTFEYIPLTETLGPH